MEEHRVPGSTFMFSAVRPQDLGATEYTLVVYVEDDTGSVNSFASELLTCKKEAIRSCLKSPKSGNLLVRNTQFSNKQVREIHGYKLLTTIDPDTEYNLSNPDGGTPLYDATYEAIGSITSYADQLAKLDILVNGIIFVITDGDDNQSKCTPSMIRQQMEQVKKSEQLESLMVVLIGVNTQERSLAYKLETFQQDTALTGYIDIQNANKASLAKLAGFVSKSISSQSQSLGSGAVSQLLTI